MNASDTANQVAIYGHLMREIKVRHSAISFALDGNTRLIGPLVREFCYLQLRMMCELVAFACLVAHDDIKDASKLRSEYKAGLIVNALEKLHEKFYPMPVKKEKVGKLWELTDTGEDYLKKADLIELNGKCGDVLHRGTLKKMLAGKIPVQTNFPEIIGWANKIRNLLNEHTIVLFENKGAILCQLQGLDGDVHVTAAEAIGHQLP